MRAVFFAVFVSTILSTSSFAAEFRYFRAEGNWREQVLTWLDSLKPEPEDVSGGFSGSFDLFIYAVPGSFKGKYSLQSVQQGKGTPNGIITALMDGRTGKILGISDNDFHMLTYTRPR